MGPSKMTAANKPLVSADRPPTAVGQQLIEKIGNTPLIRLMRTGTEFPNVKIAAKAEWFNPGGSVKDRAAYSMIREGERSGDLRPGKIILDATSGNTGIAYAMVGAALGYRVKLCLPIERVARAQADSAGVRRRNCFHSRRRRNGRRDPSRSRNLQGRSREIFLSRSVRQSRESRRALQHHRAGNLGADARADHAFRRGTGNQRHIRRHHAPAEGIESEDSLHQHAAGFRFSRPRRLEAHGDRDCAFDLRCELADENMEVRTEDAHKW